MNTLEHQYGFHRVVAPQNVFPQAAERLDNNFSAIHASELLINVDALHLDSSSFRQIKNSCAGDLNKITARILEIVETRGKMHNPVTNSGGMLIGRVARKGDLFPEAVSTNDIIATLVSLSLTPLKINEILSVETDSGVVRIKGQAVLFSSGIFQTIPPDISLELFLKVMDVCGAPLHAYELCKDRDEVLVLGAAGKSGVLSLASASKRGCRRIIACDFNEEKLDELKSLGLAHEYVAVDATDPREYFAKLAGLDAEVTISCVNIHNAEMAAVIATRQGGNVCFFCMATNFQRATLGAEGIGRDVNLIMGNGYKKNHARFALDLIKENKLLREYLNGC